MTENEKILTPSTPESPLNFEIGPIDQIPADVKTLSTLHLTAFAGPMQWGTWIQIGSHTSAIDISINYKAIGNTVVHGAVNFYNPQGWVTLVFKDSITISTGNRWASVFVCFYGHPYGSAVNVKIN